MPDRVLHRVLNKVWYQVLDRFPGECSLEIAIRRMHSREYSLENARPMENDLKHALENALENDLKPLGFPPQIQ